MDFARIISLVKWEVILFTGGLALTIAIKALTGQVNARYLLYGIRRDGTRYFSPERVQMLIATTAVATQYVVMASRTGEMPQLSSGTLELLGLSHAVYLSGKGFTAFRDLTKNTK